MKSHVTVTEQSVTAVKGENEMQAQQNLTPCIPVTFKTDEADILWNYFILLVCIFLLFPLQNRFIIAQEVMSQRACCCQG